MVDFLTVIGFGRDDSLHFAASKVDTNDIGIQGLLNRDNRLPDLAVYAGEQCSQVRAGAGGLMKLALRPSGRGVAHTALDALADRRGRAR